MGSGHVCSCDESTSTVGRDFVRQSDSVMNGMPLHMRPQYDARPSACNSVEEGCARTRNPPTDDEEVALRLPDGVGFPGAVSD